MDRTIRITGKGRLAVQADTIEILLTLSATHEEYSEAVAHSAKAAGDLKEALAKASFDPDDLKTNYFSVNSKYESVQDAAGHYRQHFVGFEYDHRLQLEIPRDQALLGKALTAFLQSGVAVEFQLVYTVKYPEQARHQLLKKAVEDAKARADQLAEAAGVRLGEILQISYAHEEIPIRQEVMRSSRHLGETVYAAVSPDLEPAEIHLDESVRLIWAIR